MSFFRSLLEDESGANAIQYGLIAALIAVAAITAIGALGNSLSNTFTLVSDRAGKVSSGGQPEDPNPCPLQWC
jgi:pilus assembly protein Flp/PilA